MAVRRTWCQRAAESGEGWDRQTAAEQEARRVAEKVAEKEAFTRDVAEALRKQAEQKERERRRLEKMAAAARERQETLRKQQEQVSASRKALEALERKLCRPVQIPRDGWRMVCSTKAMQEIKCVRCLDPRRLFESTRGCRENWNRRRALQLQGSAPVPSRRARSSCRGMMGGSHTPLISLISLISLLSSLPIRPRVQCGEAAAAGGDG